MSVFLRIYKVSNYPVGLAIDEVSIGNNAYSILSEGYDEHNQRFPLFFKAFGEYKLPVYIYLTTISMFFLGKNELAIRMPSVFSGVVAVFFLYHLFKKIFKKKKIALLAAFFLSVSGWHLQFSRAGFEASIALTEFILGIYLFISFINDRKYRLVKLFFSLFFAGLTFYSYNAYRIITPFVGLLLLQVFSPFIKSDSKYFLKHQYKIIIIFLFFAIFLVPFLNFNFSKEGLVRAKSEFFAIDSHVSPEDFFPDIKFHILEDFFKNYARYFSLNFLFFHGDQIGRHSVREMGQENLVWLPFFIFGLYRGFKNRKKYDELIFGLLILAPVAASISKPHPHALRSLTMVLPFSILTARGILFFIKEIRFRRLKILMVTLIFIYWQIFYLHVYYIHNPKRAAVDWGSGYREMIAFLESESLPFEKIFINDKFGEIKSYLHFYADKTKDKYIFVKAPYIHPLDSKALYVTDTVEKWQGKVYKQVYSFANDNILTIWEN
jgi:4-amino-4-deoxy-L-arabinose transferase-like glycosyltransferase